MATARQQKALGAYGEKLAERHLAALGMTVLDRNWRCRSGELDLVLRDHDDLVVCEVKARRGVGFGPPLLAVREEKFQRIRRLALLWVEAHGLVRPAIRVDLVGVLLPRRGPAQIDHVIGVG
jgi:putative endonuclease